MFSDEFSKICQDFRMNPAEASIVVQVLPRDLRNYDWLIVVLVLWNCLYIMVCVNWYTFTVIMKVFRKFRDRNIVLPMSSFVSGRTGDL